MKKQKKFSDLSADDIHFKCNELIKELVKSRVSMDPSVLSANGGIVALRRDLRTLSRQKFQIKK